MKTAPYLTRAGLYLHDAGRVIEEALADIAIADQQHPEKQNEISKLRVKINRTKLRLAALARHAAALSKTKH